MPANIRNFTIELASDEYSLIKMDESTRSYQTKILKDMGDTKFVRVYTNRPDSLLKDFGKVLAVSKNDLQERFGMETDEEKAARVAAKERKQKLFEIRKQARELAKKHGYNLSQLLD